jgi:hypothetical protein
MTAKKRIDPFEQADLNENKQKEPINEKADEISEIKKPAVVSTINQKTPRPIMNKVFPIISSVAIVTGIIAVVISVLTIKQVGNFRSDTASVFEDVDKNIESLGLSQNESEAKLNKITQRTINNSKAIERFDTSKIRKDINVIHKAISTADFQLQNSKSDFEKNMDTLNAEIKLLKNEITLLNQFKIRAAVNNKSVTAKPKKKKTRPAKIVPKTSLNGIEVVSIDQWGHESNVVLLNPITEQYQVVSQGDEFDGWLFVGSDQVNQIATFKKDGQLIVVKVSG